MIAIRVDMEVSVTLNDVVDMMCGFGVIFFVAGLCWFGRTFIILWHHLYPGIYKAKAEARSLTLALLTLVRFVGFKL